MLEPASRYLAGTPRSNGTAGRTITSTLRHTFVVLLFLAAVFPRGVHAYADPSTGSLVFQTVVAALAAVAYEVPAYWGRIRMLFGRRQDRPGVESNDGGV